MALGREYPADYNRRRALIYSVTKQIEGGRIARPQDIETVFGPESLGPYYFQHALLRTRKRRRDGKPLPRHSFDAASQSFYRFKQSGYLLKYPVETSGTLVHDVGEDFGESLIGAMAVNDAIGYLFGSAVGRIATAATSGNGLILKSLDRVVEQMDPQVKSEIDQYVTIGMLERLKSKEAAVTSDDILGSYRSMIDALERFRNYVLRRASYLENASQARISGIVENLETKLTAKIKGGILDTGRAREGVDWQFQNVISIAQGNNLLEIDDALRGNDENRYLLALKKTLYADFINAIANAVLEEYVRFLEDPKGHPDYTAPMMVKLADLTETASNLESQSIDHVISIFRKVRRGIWSAHDLAPKIKPAELPRDGEYQRLQNAQNFLFYALDSGVRANFKFYKKRAPYQTSLETERDAFGEMAKKMDELKATLKTTEDISLLSRFRVRGNSFLF